MRTSPKNLKKMALLLTLANASIMSVSATSEAQAQFHEQGQANLQPHPQTVNGVTFMQEYVNGMPRFNVITGMGVVDMFPSNPVVDEIMALGAQAHEIVERFQQHSFDPRYAFSPETVVIPQFGQSRPGVPSLYRLRNGRIFNLQGTHSSAVDNMARWEQLGPEDEDAKQIYKMNAAWEFFADGQFVYTEVGQMELMREGVFPENIRGRWNFNPRRGVIEFRSHRNSSQTGGVSSDRLEGTIRRDGNRILADVRYRSGGGAVFHSPYGFASAGSHSAYSYSTILSPE